MAEMARVLRPGGLAAVTVPRWGPEKVCWALSDAYHEVEGGHVRIYRKGQLRTRLEAVGLQQVGSHYAHALHAPYWWLRCVVGRPRRRPPCDEALPPTAGVGHDGRPAHHPHG